MSARHLCRDPLPRSWTRGTRQITGTTTNYSFLNRQLTSGYSYDAASNRLTFTDPEGATVNYTYDSLNRLTNLTDSVTGAFGFGYDVLGRRTSLTRPNNVSTNYQYDNLSRLLSVLHQLGGNTIDGAAYTVDSIGNRTSKADALAGVTSNFTYDAIYQLTQVVQGQNTTETYSYDAVGNRLSSLGISPYSYNSSNELTSTPSVGFTYDNNGNTTSKTDSNGTTGYTWDFENRLASVTLPGDGGTVSFQYDPFGRRIEKVAGVGTTVYAYDGDNVVEELDAGGMPAAHYSQGLGIDEPLAMNGSSVTSFYDADGLGSVTSLSDGSGQIAASYTYDSFGDVTNSTGTLTNPFRYTGREWDSETALYYYRARYYDSMFGRFLSEDPNDFASDVNFYSYVLNRPTDLVDPSGRMGKRPHVPAPTPDPEAAFYICCQGGAFGVCDGPLARPSAFDNPIFNMWKLKCQKEHERQHQEDFSAGKYLYAIEPSSCVGQRNNRKIYVNLAYKGRVECPGYQRQLQCLLPMESLMTTEINGVKDQLKRYKCDCGK